MSNYACNLLGAYKLIFLSFFRRSQNILNWIVDTLPNSIWLAYEQCNSNDAFGKIMVNHFCRTGCPIYSLMSSNSAKEQKKQLHLAVI